jgi:hypothetical protein
MEVPSTSIWKKISIESFDYISNLNEYQKAKYCKMFPHILFPEYDYSIWVDGNIVIIADLYPLADRLCRLFIGMFGHPSRSCIYSEAEYIKYTGIANFELVSKQIDKYRKEGFPENYGIREAGVIVRKHHDEKCVLLMEQWWEEVNMHTMRDQLSLPYLLWKQGYKMGIIKLLGNTLRNNPRFMGLDHIKKLKY